MVQHNRESGVPRPRRRSRAFTLVELLVVVAIIALLISILLPSLAAARESAKKAATRNTQKVIAEGLELFRVENEAEFRGYPPSTVREDQTEEDEQNIFGAQWIARYLMGKDLRGYVPRRAVPPSMVIRPGDADYDTWRQKDWYEASPEANDGQPLERIGPYVSPDDVEVVRAGELNGRIEGNPDVDDRTLSQFVILDAFRYPILYYTADVRYARRPAPYPVRYWADVEEDGGGGGGEGGEGGERYGGIYVQEDNAIFTGMALDQAEARTMGGGDYPGWDLSLNAKVSPVKYFGPNPPEAEEIDEDKNSFAYYLLDRNAYDASDEDNRIVRPVNADSFILWSPGADGIYGNKDDVTNF